MSKLRTIKTRNRHPVQANFFYVRRASNLRFRGLPGTEIHFHFFPVRHRWRRMNDGLLREHTSSPWLPTPFVWALIYRLPLRHRASKWRSRQTRCWRPCAGGGAP